MLVVIEVEFSSSLQAVNLEQKQQFQDYLLKFTTLVAAKNHLIMKEAGELSHPQSRPLSGNNYQINEADHVNS